MPCSSACSNTLLSRTPSSIGTVLCASLDHDAVLLAIAQLAVPYVADVCVVDAVNDDGVLRRVEVSYACAADEMLAARTRRAGQHLAENRDDPAVRALSTQRAISLCLPSTMMPEMDGFHFRAQQLLEPAHRDLPLVVVTAGATVDHAAL